MLNSLLRLITVVMTVALYFTLFISVAFGQSDGYDSAANSFRIIRFVIPAIILIAICIGGGACCRRKKRLAAQRAAARQNGQFIGPYPVINQTVASQNQMGMGGDYPQSPGHTWGQPYVIQPPADNKDTSNPPPAYSEIYPAPPPYSNFTESSANPSVK